MNEFDKYDYELKKLHAQKLLVQKPKRKKYILKFAGIANGDIGEKSIQEIKLKKSDCNLIIKNIRRT